MAQHRHKRDANARPRLRMPSFRMPSLFKQGPVLPRAALVALPVAVVATASAVTLGVVAQQPPPGRELMASSLSATTGFEASLGASADRGPVVTRGSARRAKAEKQIDAARREIRATRTAVRTADTRLWTTEDLNLWSDASAEAVRLGLVDAGEKVLATGRERGDRAEIVVGGESRWVSAAYLVDEKPVPEAPAAPAAQAVQPEQVSDAGCTNGTSVPSGVSPNVVKVHQAVCAAFPTISSYGTFRGDGEHAQGIAVDIMVSGSLGWEIAEFIRANYQELGVSYLIYSQKIWSVERSGEGWRGMSDRGSTTANHYDHVHVTTY